MAFDRHLNLVLGDAEEFRPLRGKAAAAAGGAASGGATGGEPASRRVLGLVILRGDAVLALAVEGPPPSTDRRPKAAAGPGVGRAAGRGMPMAPPPGGAAGPPPGLAGPVPGLGAAGGPGMVPPPVGGPPPGWRPGVPPPGGAPFPPR